MSRKLARSNTFNHCDPGISIMKNPVVHLHVSSREADLAMGRQLDIRAGIAACPFGECLIALSSIGICHLSIFDPGCSQQTVREFQSQWPGAAMTWDHTNAAKLARRIFSNDSGDAWNVHVRGTPFQIRVWRALRSIPAGQVTTYGALAAAAGNPEACRATGSAVGKNEVSILIPCHRVIRADGACGQYRWGAATKSAILAWEAARRI